MTLPYDLRNTRDPLGAATTRKRRLLELVKQEVVSSMAEGTASNYYTKQYGSNHRIFYEGVAGIVGALLIESIELSDDSQFSKVRSEFLGRKVLDHVFVEEADIPLVASEEALKSLLVSTILTLLNGSKEEGILQLLSQVVEEASIEVTQIDNHLIGLLIKSFVFTSEEAGHKHLVVESKAQGLTSTTSPISWSWGDDLHQHDIIDGVVQEAQGHTHTIQFQVPQDVVTIQQNILKLLAVTKPAHIKIGRVSNLASESITKPSENSVTYSRSEEGFQESLSEEGGLVFSLGASFQENMRRSRQGVYEKIILGYAKGRKIRFRSTLLEIRDRVRTSVIRRVTSYVEVTPTDGEYEFYFLRLGETRTYTISNQRIEETDRFFGDGEIVVLSQGGVEKGAYFLEILSRTICRVSAYEATFDAVSSETGLVECELLEYSWNNRTPKYREIYGVVESQEGTTSTFKLNAPIQKVYQGLPLLKSMLISIDEYELVSYDAISNTLVVSAVLAVGESALFRVPFGEGDIFNFSELNNTAFVLNNFRSVYSHPNLSGRGSSTHTYRRNVALADKPANGLYPVSQIKPLIKQESSLETSISQGGSLNEAGFTLGGKLRLNQSLPIAPLPRLNIKDYAIGVSLIQDHKTPLHTFGFLPSQIISIVDLTTNLELTFSLRDNVLYFSEEIPDGRQIRLTGISEQPLGKQKTWARSESTLSEGQVSFYSPIDASTYVSSVEKVMSNPQGRKLLSTDVDEPRKNSYQRNVTTTGQLGEEVFAEDDLLSLNIESVPFIMDIEILTKSREPYKTGLILNDTRSKLGSRIALNFSRNVLLESVFIRQIGEDVDNLTDTIPTISDDVLTAQGIGVLETLSLISDDVSTSLTLVSISLTDILNPFSDVISTSLLLYPSNIVETLPLISDDVSISQTQSASLLDNLFLSDEVSTSLSFTPIGEADSITLSDDMTYFYTLSEISLGDSVGVSDEVQTTMTFSPILVSDSMSLTDNVGVVISEQINVQDTIGLISDEALGVLSSLSLLDELNFISDEISLNESRVVSDSLLGLTDDVVASFSYLGVEITDTMGLISDDANTPPKVVDSVGAVSDSVEVTLSLNPLIESDNFSPITDEVTLLQNRGVSVQDTLPIISEHLMTDLFLTPSGVSDTLLPFTDEVSLVQHISVSVEDTFTALLDEVSKEQALSITMSDSVGIISDVMTADLLLGGVDVVDSLNVISDEVSVAVDLGGLATGDTLVLITDSVEISLSYAAVLVEDSMSSISDVVSISYVNLGLGLTDTLSSINDEVSILLNMEGVLESDVLAQITDAVETNLILQATESLPDITDEVSYLSHVTTDISDVMGVITDDAEGTFNAPANFTLFAALLANNKTTTDAERFIIYTQDDYFARRGSSTPTLFSSFPTSTIHADSNSATFLTNTDTRRGFIKTLIQPYTNTTPPSANISWALQGNSTTDGELMPNIDYFIVARTLYDDTASDVSLAWQTGADGSNTTTIMGASPSYNQLYPTTTNLGNKYFKHTLSVSDTGVVSFTQDTTAKNFAYTSTTRLYFFVQNLDGGLGAAASVNSSIRVTTAADSFITPTIHVGSEVSTVSGTATFVKSNITNPNNDAQVSWALTPMTSYKIILNRDAAVDMKIFILPYANTTPYPYNTLYSSADTLDYRGFDNSKLGLTFYLQILEDGTILITN